MSSVGSRLGPTPKSFIFNKNYILITYSQCSIFTRNSSFFFVYHFLRYFLLKQPRFTCFCIKIGSNWNLREFFFVVVVVLCNIYTYFIVISHMIVSLWVSSVVETHFGVKSLKKGSQSLLFVLLAHITTTTTTKKSVSETFCNNHLCE